MLLEYVRMKTNLSYIILVLLFFAICFENDVCSSVKISFPRESKKKKKKKNLGFSFIHTLSN